MAAPESRSGPELIVTERGEDQLETTLVLTLDLALALKLYVPAALQVFDCVAEPQAERFVLPSPLQSNSYCTGFPRLEVEPPVV